MDILEIQSKINELKDKAEKKSEQRKEEIAYRMAEEELNYFTICDEQNLDPGRDVAMIYASNTGKAIIVSRPKEVVYKNYKKAVNKFLFKDKEDVDHDFDLVSSCLIYPTQKEFNTICQETPAITTFAAAEISRMAGVMMEDVEKK